VRRANAMFTWKTVTRAISTLYRRIESGRAVTDAAARMADAA
jgi:hypothetical protein